MTEHTEAANTTDAAASPVTDTAAIVAAPEATPVTSETPAIEAAVPTPPVVKAVAGPQPAEELLKVEASRFEALGIDRPVTEQISFAAPQLELPKDETPRETATSSASIFSL